MSFPLQLELDRANLVRRYRANCAAFPDGIDPKDPRNGEQWYRGHEAEWTDERIARVEASWRDWAATGKSSTAMSSKTRLEDMSTKMSTKDGPIVKDAAYWRERKRAQRARDQS